MLRRPSHAILHTQRPDSSGRAPSTQPLALRGGPSCEEAQPARPGVFRLAWRPGRAGCRGAEAAAVQGGGGALQADDPAGSAAGMETIPRRGLSWPCPCPRRQEDVQRGGDGRREHSGARWHARRSRLLPALPNPRRTASEGGCACPPVRRNRKYAARRRACHPGGSGDGSAGGGTAGPRPRASTLRRTGAMARACRGIARGPGGLGRWRIGAGGGAAVEPDIAAFRVPAGPRVAEMPDHHAAGCQPVPTAAGGDSAGIAVLCLPRGGGGGGTR